MIGRPFYTMFFVVTFLSAFHSEEVKFNAILARVLDGDTVALYRVLDSGEKKLVTCRLYGIDAPEKDQDYGTESRLFLESLLSNREIRFLVVGNDMYGRSICILYSKLRTSQNSSLWAENEHSSEIIINEEMLKNGAAWAYLEYLKKDPERMKDYKSFERQAIQKGLGLWYSQNPVPPWEFRKLSKKNRNKPNSLPKKDSSNSKPTRERILKAKTTVSFLD